MTLETERLILRSWTLDDFESFADMHAEPDVNRFLNDGKPLSRFAAWQGFSAIVGHWQLRGFGIFALVERQTGKLAGRVGPWFPEGWPDCEIAWTLRSAFWGRGYATEAARRCLAYAFTELRRDHVVSLIDPANLPSARVAVRIGEQFEDNIAHPNVPQKTVDLYGLHKCAWKNRT
jgi:RimJ/RimL family protein N-acetyltransferase